MANTLGTIECTIENCLTDRDGSLVMALRAKSGERRSVEKILDKVLSCQKSTNKRLTAQFAWCRENRSLNANSYFHVLAGKIAEALGENLSDIKQMLVCDYGTSLGILAVDNGRNPYESGMEYVRWIGYESDKSSYMVFKPTHTLDTAEMARLIDGTISEAQQLGIETKTPAELDKIKSLWASDKE